MILSFEHKKVAGIDCLSKQNPTNVILTMYLCRLNSTQVARQKLVSTIEHNGEDHLEQILVLKMDCCAQVESDW